MFRDWPDAALDRLVDSAQLRQHRRHATIAPNGGGQRYVLVVVTGAIETSGVSEDGSRFVLSVLGPGEITALAHLLDAVEIGFAFTARVDSMLVHLPTDALRQVLDGYPLLWRAVALLALARQQGNIDLLQRQALGGLSQKIGQALLRLAQWSGRPLDDPDGITLRVSQADVAAMVAVTRQTINKEMKSLARSGLVSVSYGRLHLHDIDALRVLATTGRLALTPPAPS